MDHIICDICGSEYAQTAERCPICSYPRQGTEKIVESAGTAAAAAKVKGGRFSEKNVRKRRRAQARAAAGAAPEKDPNRPLWIVIVVLLIAIVLVSAYIGIRFFRGRDVYRGSDTTAPVQTTQPAGTTVPPTVACTGMELETSIILEEAGQEHQLDVTIRPDGTTDAVTYVSSDPAVAEVTEKGLVIANGPGQATITVTCGEVVKECTVFCWFAEETTMPVETTRPVETTVPVQTTAPVEEGLVLDVTDVSCFALNEAFTLSVRLNGRSVKRSDVTWTTSDPGIATVENGKVTAVGKGTATITAEYKGEKATCVVRCRFEDTSWRASATDVTLSVGESFRLTVTNGSGETADAIWTMDQEGVVSIQGKTVTGRAPGDVTLTTTVDGVTMTCIVRVK